ncbi:alcohol dehydrogenase [Moniliophthora roreri]|nr:alcohol dehydrogenase [Moniliophthora roreri]
MPGQVVPKATLHPEWHRYPFLLCASRELIRYAGSLIVLNLGYTTYQFKSISDLWDALASFHGDPDGTHHHDEFARKTGNDAWEWSRSFWRREGVVAYNFPASTHLEAMPEHAHARYDRETLFYSYDPKDENG